MPAEQELFEGPSRPKVRVPLKIEEVVAAVSIGLLALITFVNVVVRYATSFSFAFTEEFSVFLMVFMALVGGSSVMAKGGHLNITYFVDKFPPAARRKIRLGATVLVALTFLILTVLGGRMAYDEYRYEVTSPGLGLPTWIYTVWLPILSLAILGRTLGVMIRIWKERA
jgi:TRAP-type C4-dicarboxylate transport system permease small subunit